MARKLFEFRATRARAGGLAVGIEYVVWDDEAATVLADISTSSGGSSIAGSTVTTADIAGLGPSACRFWGPTEGQDTLWVTCPSDPTLGVQRVEASTDARLDALEAAGGGAHPNLATHDALGLATQVELDAVNTALDTRVDSFEGREFWLHDHGGVGDNTTNNDTAMAAWKTAAITGGGYRRMRAKAGRYRFNTPFVWPTNVNFEGEGSLPGDAGGTEFLYGGSGTSDWMVAGAAGSDWSNSQLRKFRITKHASAGSITAGTALRVYNPTNKSIIEDVLISDAPDGQILIDNNVTGGSGNPGPNFFRMAQFFLFGGVYPLRIRGGLQQMVLDFGGIDIDATSLAGMLVDGGASEDFTATVTGVKVEGSFDVPGFKVTGLSPATFIGCSRWNDGLNGATKAAFQYTNPAQSLCMVDLLNCTVRGHAKAFENLETGAVSAGVQASTIVSTVLSSRNTMIVPSGSNDFDKTLTLHKDIKFAWTTNTGSTAAVDTNLYRNSADVLQTDDDLFVGAGLTIAMNNTSKLFFGSAFDTNLYRASANLLKTDDSFQVVGSFQVDQDLPIATVGKTLKIAEGANAKMGTATLVAGVATVATTAVTANSRIQLTSQVDGGTPGFLRVSTRTAGTSFVVTSSSGADTSTVAWLILEPA